MPIVSVRPGTTVGSAARVLQRTGAPFVLIEGHQHVLARDDVVRALADIADDMVDDVDSNTDVCELARSAVLVVGSSTPALAVLGEMVRSGATGVMVVDDRRCPEGFLRMRDLVAALLDELALLAGLRHVLHVDTAQ